MSQISYALLRSLRIGEDSAYPFASMPSGIGVDNVRAAIAPQGVDGQRFLGGDRLNARLITFDLHIIADTSAARLIAAEALQAAWGPVREGTIDLTLAVNGVERLVSGRPLRCDILLDKLTKGSLRARCSFETSDPRFFGATANSIVLGLSGGTGGLEYPLTYPLTYGAGSDSDGSALNAGNIETSWTATIIGPVTVPRLTLGSTGQYIELDGTIPDGSTLVLMSATRSILLNGSPRQTWLTLPSRWWSLVPGVNTVRFRAASGTGACTFSWRSAWL